MEIAGGIHPILGLLQHYKRSDRGSGKSGIYIKLNFLWLIPEIHYVELLIRVLAVVVVGELDDAAARAMVSGTCRCGETGGRRQGVLLHYGYGVLKYCKICHCSEITL